MIHTISNSSLRLSVQQTGAEICSIQSVKSGKEYIWQADPVIWGSHAPVLFPIIGSLKNNEYYYDGMRYSIPKHGFIRYSEKLDPTNNTSDRIVFKLKSDAETLNMYPFDFEFIVTFQLLGNRINIMHKVTNLDFKEMFFSLGAHPAFRCPINDNEIFDDYFIEFETTEKASSHRFTDG